MSLDPVKNFAKGILSVGISSTDTSLTLQSGDGDKFPDPSGDGEYNCVIWNSTDYGDPADDPDKEIVRVTAKSTDTFTITRGQEGTTAVNHDTSGKTYKMVLSLTKKTIDDIKSTFLKLDQTTPQTIDNGVPLLDDTPNGAVDIKSLVNKEYVDLAVTSLGTVYYMYDEDDGTGYKTCYLDPSSDAETYIEKSSLSDDDYIGGWISASGEEPTKLLKGVYNWYLTAEKTTGTQELRIYWKLVERKSDDSEIVIATSSNSNIITDKGDYIVPLQLSSDYLPDSGSRIVGKLYADVSGGGSSPTVRVYYQGSTSSRWEIPANSEVFKNIFVPYSGATKDVDMNTHKISGVVDPTSDQDAATKKYVDDNSIGSVVEDTTPQLGGDLDVNGYGLTSSTGLDISIGASAGNDFTVDTDKLVVEGDTGNVGIGTTSPESRLHINGDAGFVLNDLGTVTTDTTIDWRNGNKAKITLGANITLSFTNPGAPCNLILMIVQDDTGGRTVTWPSNVKWAGGVAPTLSSDASAVDIISFFYDGVNYYGQASLDFK